MVSRNALLQGGYLNKGVKDERQCNSTCPTSATEQGPWFLYYYYHYNCFKYQSHSSYFLEKMTNTELVETTQNIDFNISTNGD